MSDNLAIWNALEKTDPAHTKTFARSGGFRGTATKPIYSIRRLTEQFGPCGIGWGMTKPEFQVVNTENEILVYCTVALWHGTPENLVYGVGGDKVRAMQKSGPFNSDEAFKASYTDALSNAMKMIGVSADIHMGCFDDHKYVKDLEREFAAEPAPNLAADMREKRANDIITQLRGAHDLDELTGLWKFFQGDIVAMPDDMRTAVTRTKDETKSALMKKAA